MAKNILRKQGLTVPASKTNESISFAFTPADRYNLHANIVMSAKVETNDIKFKLQDSFDGGETWYDVGDQSEAVPADNKTFNAGVAEVATVTFPAYSAAAQGDYILMTAQNENTYAVWLQKNLVASKVIGNLTYTAQTGGTAGNSITITHASTLDDASASVTVTGTDIVVDMEAAATTATTIKAAIEASAEASALVSVVIEEGEGSTAQAAASETALEGGDDDEPTGEKYEEADVTIEVEIESGDTAAQVATKAKAAIGTIMNADFTVGTPSGADIVFTQVNTGAVDDPDPENTDDSGAGSITVSVGTAGSNGNITLSTGALAITSHGLITGTPVAYSAAGGTALGGFSAGLYYVINGGANSLRLATSQLNASNGQAVIPTSYGAGSNHTLAPALCQIRMVNSDSTDAAQLPVFPQCRVVVSTAADDTVTIDSIWVES